MSYFLFTSSEDYYPYIKFTHENLDIVGQSSMQDPFDFYISLINSIKKYKDKIKNLQINIKLDYYNTTTSKCIYDILEMLTDKKERVKEINWFYYDNKIEDIYLIEKSLNFKINKIKND